jgi:exopolysaccharide biosynthesis polyprenyl glycosylphosphotransferase
MTIAYPILDSASDVSRRPPRPKAAGGAHIAPDLIAEIIPLIAGAVVVVAAILAHVGCVLLGFGPKQAIPATLGIACIAAAITFEVFEKRSPHESAKLKGRAFDARAIAGALASAFLLLFALLSLLGASDEFGLDFMSVWLGLSYALILPAMAAMTRCVRLQRVALYGNGRLATKVAKCLFDSDHNSLVVGVYDDPPLDDVPSLAAAKPQIPKRGIKELAQCARDGDCDRIVVVLPIRDEERIGGIMRHLEGVPVDVQLCTEILPVPCEVQGGVVEGPMLLLNVQRHPLGARGIIIKSIMDYALAAVAIVALAPLMALIAITIKLDSSGPVLFVQARTGYRQRAINVFKFRTMRVLENGPVVVQAQRDDPRVTRVGRFLRRTSLDELPQLFNVLRGDMSIVGPRPIVTAEISRYGRRFQHYCAVKPGITGLWQVSGRNDVAYRRRVAMDTIYARHKSLLWDIKLLLLTVPAVLFASGSY